MALPAPVVCLLAAAFTTGAAADSAGLPAPRRELAPRGGATTADPSHAEAGLRTTTTPWYTTKTTIIAEGTLSLEEATELKESSKQTLALKPWRHPQPGVRPGECPGRFVPPPKAPHYATELNGVSLPDACFNSSSGPHHVFVIGDWGGVLGGRGDRPVPADRRSKHMPSHHRPFVLGADDRAQQNVAAQMEKRSAVHSPDYVLNLGDNFYWGGVLVKCGGPAFGVEDASGQWEWVFERTYDFEGLKGKQWLGVLGNHDYGGFMFTHGWDQAIGYTWTKRHPSRGRWVTPAQYWSAKVHYHGFSVDYFFVDSNPWDAFEPRADPGHNLCSQKHNLEKGATCGPMGPVSVEECPEWFDRLWEAQVAWLNHGLGDSTADWQIIVTHFPPEHGLMDWKRLTSDHGVDLLISGHRHQQEVHHLEESNLLRPTAYIVSGGGGGITSEGLPDAEGHDDQYGFMDLTLTKDEIRIEAISHGGDLRSETCIRQLSRSGKLAPKAGHSLCRGHERHPARHPGPAPATGTWALSGDSDIEHHDCEEGRSDWQMLWSFSKGMWCCKHRHVCVGAFRKEQSSRTSTSASARVHPDRYGRDHRDHPARTHHGRPTSTTQSSTTTTTITTASATTTTLTTTTTSTEAPAPSPAPASPPQGSGDVAVLHTTQEPPEMPRAVPTVLVPMGALAPTPVPEGVVSFDCLAGYYNLENEWSEEKRFWCCAHEKLGCNHLHNCNLKDPGNPITSWSWDKMQFCCVTYGVSCLHTRAPTARVVQEALYNCNPGSPGNSLDTWLDPQAEYCCNNFQVGCDAPGSPAPPAPVATSVPTAPPTTTTSQRGARFDCQADLLDWELMWSVAKQEWCCRHEQLGCSHFKDCRYNDGGNAYSSWSLSKKEWCCMHWGVKCADISSSPRAGFGQLWFADGPPALSRVWRPRIPEPLRLRPLLSAAAGVAALAAAAVAARKLHGRRGRMPVRGLRIAAAAGDGDWEDELLSIE